MNEFKYFTNRRLLKITLKIEGNTQYKKKTVKPNKVDFSKYERELNKGLEKIMIKIETNDIDEIYEEIIS